MTVRGMMLGGSTPGDEADKLWAAEHTGVKPCAFAVGNKPDGRHIHK